MAKTIITTTDVRSAEPTFRTAEPSLTGRFADCSVSWASIIGGALAAVAISLVLLILASAYGLSEVSPWSSPETITSFTVKTAIVLIVMQWLASGVGGYIAGRLRHRWTNLSLDEVLFRDTAHGLLSWVVATLLSVTVLSTTIASIAGGGVQASAIAAAGHPGPRGPATDYTGYLVDNLFRSPAPNPQAPAPEARMETTRILALGVKDGALVPEDKAYLTQLVSARTGVDTVTASQRVDNLIAQSNARKEELRKNAMHASLYIALSMLVGAFIASAAAALGGRHRDEY